MESTIVLGVLALLVIIVIAKTAVVVPQQSAFVVERLGRFHGILSAGFHILIPFLDVIRYRHSLKEVAIDIPAQVCITRDNVQVGVDGILYLKVLNPERASYGISDFGFAITQLAQTMLRSEIGKIDLDRSFEERMNINAALVTELDKASEAWGVKVLRYEIKNITPPHDVLAAMEKQMRAEREKRAVILTSEGQRDAAINTAEGEKQQVIKRSEASRQQQIKLRIEREILRAPPSRSTLPERLLPTKLGRRKLPHRESRVGGGVSRIAARLPQFVKSLKAVSPLSQTHEQRSEPALLCARRKAARECAPLPWGPPGNRIQSHRFPLREGRTTSPGRVARRQASRELSGECPP